MASRRTMTIWGIAGAILFVILIVLVFKTINFGSKEKNVTLQFWGVFDEPSLFQEAISNFHKQNPNINVVYKKLTYEEYENSFINALASGTGPDIIMIQNSWLPKHFDKLEPMPLKTKYSDKPFLTFNDYQKQYVDVVTADLTASQRIYGVPLYVDTLALYYNKDLFNDSGIISPPRTWDELNENVKKLTIKNQNGDIVRSGIAMGTARNINRSTDILAMLMLQNGTRMTNSDNTSATFANAVRGVETGVSALRYYTDFSYRTNPLYTWDDDSHYSIDAFAQGETAMMINYSHQIPTIRSKSARFNFGVAEIPQFSGADVGVAYANYWALGVLKQSKNIDESWKFLAYMSSDEGTASYLNASGRPSAKKTFIVQQRNDIDLGVFADQALIARSWYQVSNTDIEKFFADMIDDVNYNRKSVREALSTAQNRLNLIMSRKKI